MVSRLVLVRHGDAESRQLGQTDAERRLTARGLEALKEAYPALLAPLADDAPTMQVWSSEATRALQTAEVACDALGIDRARIELHTSLYAQDEDFFLGELEATQGVVMAVGHIPFMEDVSSRLARRMMSFPKGSIACFEFDGTFASARRAWFARGPKVW